MGALTLHNSLHASLAPSTSPLPLPTRNPQASLSVSGHTKLFPPQASAEQSHSMSTYPDSVLNLLCSSSLCPDIQVVLYSKGMKGKTHTSLPLPHCPAPFTSRGSQCCQLPVCPHKVRFLHVSANMCVHTVLHHFHLAIYPVFQHQKSILILLPHSSP